MTMYEAGSLAVSCLGFLAVAWTLKMNGKELKMNADQSVLSQNEIAMTPARLYMLEIHRAMIEHDGVRRYFHDGAHLAPDDPNAERVRSLAMLYIDSFDQFLANMKLYPEAFKDSEQYWKQWFRDMFASSPVLLEEFMRVKDWYPAYFEDLVPECKRPAVQRDEAPSRVDPTPAVPQLSDAGR